MRRAGGEAGLGLVEVMLSVVIFGFVMALAVQALMSGQRIASEEGTTAAVTNSIESALALMRQEIRQSGGTTSASGITVTASSVGSSGNSNQAISFKVVVGFDATNQAPTWSGEAITYFYDAGAGAVKRTGPTTYTTSSVGVSTRTLATNVASSFGFTLVPDEVTINITGVKNTSTDNQPVTVSGTSKVLPWN